MVDRPFWIERIEAAWKEAPIAWLSGVRRVGKTTLARSLGEERTFYVNCDLPAAEDMVGDPALFYRDCPRPVIVFDANGIPTPSIPRPSRSSARITRRGETTW